MLPSLQVQSRHDAVSAEWSVQQEARRARDGVAMLRMRLSNVTPAGPAVVERAFWLDPDAVDIVLSDAQQARAGAKLEIQLDPSTPPGVLARVRGHLARLEQRGIDVAVRRARRAEEVR